MAQALIVNSGRLLLWYFGNYDQHFSKMYCNIIKIHLYHKSSNRIHSCLIL